MSSFGRKSYLTSDAPKVVAHSLFLLYDKDESGHLTRDEIHELLIHDMGLTEEATEAFIMLVDTDASHCITFEEFWQAIETKQTDFIFDHDGTKYHRLLEAVKYFRTIDNNNDGFIDRDELDELCKSLDIHPSPEANESLMKIDQDGDDKISFQEFVQWLNWF